MSKELPKKHMLKLSNNVEAEVEFSYPRLPPKCSSCEKWGHLSNICVATMSNIKILKRSDTNSPSKQTAAKKGHELILKDIPQEYKVAECSDLVHEESGNEGTRQEEKINGEHMT